MTTWAWSQGMLKIFCAPVTVNKMKRHSSPFKNWPLNSRTCKSAPIFLFILRMGHLASNSIGSKSTSYTVYYLSLIKYKRSLIMRLILDASFSDGSVLHSCPVTVWRSKGVAWVDSAQWVVALVPETWGLGCFCHSCLCAECPAEGLTGRHPALALASCVRRGCLLAELFL